MRVLIAGCGDVGNVLAQQLLNKGHIVYGLKRNTASLADGVQAIQADLVNPSTLLDLPENIDSLVFMPTPGSRDQAAYEAVFVQGWKNLWSALKQAPMRSIMVSSTAVYGHSDGTVVTEETPPGPHRFNGKVLLEMEGLGRRCTDNLVVARISGIYGPGREGMIRLAASRGLEIQQSPPYFTNRIHRDDAASALMHLLLMDEPQALYLVSDDQPVPKFEVISWLAKTLGNSAPKALINPEADCGKRVNNQRLRSSGFKLKFPDYRAGYSSVLEQGKRNELSK